MIPYFHIPPLEIIPGTIEVHAFGALVGTAVVLGSWLAQRHAERQGLHGVVIGDLSIWVVILAFIFAHEVSLFAYYPERVFGTPCPTGVCPVPGADAGVSSYLCGANGRCNDGDWRHIFYIWNGISSFGGFLGAAIAFFTFFRFRRIVILPRILELVGGKGQPVLRYMDSIAYGFGAAWIFGRTGCFTAHDHVGKPSESFLAVNFPDGWRSGVPAVEGIGAPGFTPRFDLGFLEIWWAVAIFALYFFWARKRTDLRPGWYAAVMCVSYAPFRFVLDGLRAIDISGADKRYLTEMFDPGLTPGHIGAIAVLAIGILIWIVGGRAAADPNYPKWGEPGPEPATGPE